MASALLLSSLPGALCRHRSDGLARRSSLTRPAYRRNAGTWRDDSRRWPKLRDTCLVSPAAAAFGRAQPPAAVAVLGTSRWRVRLMAEDEMKAAAEIQFQGFHRPIGFLPLNALSEMNFRAEVFSTLKQKMGYTEPDSYACLIVERSGSDRALGGVADVSVQSDREVRRHLPEEVEDFAYLSSMAVDAPARRQGAAQALLTEAERLTCAWKKRYLALHLHNDNAAALALYRRSGFEQLDVRTPFLGRTRILMAKAIG